ncbi:MAG TPA: hypothetical protein VLG13_01520 [Patescibacteria group bacterium]|nr:hypothetical protein [Patescibacteria group bacterium]
MHKPKLVVRPIIKGFEFGHGKISGVAADYETLQLVSETINSPDILVPIDNDDDGRPITDDGCGDGRGVVTVFSLDKPRYKHSLNRSKVFGGSATMATACEIGLGETHGLTLNELFEGAIKTLDDKELDFGAHTDEHMHGKNCGCGAIDRAPEILAAILKYEIPTRGIITYFTKRIDGLDELYANFRNSVPQLLQHPYSGMEVMDTILNNNRTRIVKQLGGEHRECRIVLNTIRDYTVNQKVVREATNDKAQIFAVDVWRMQDIAQNLYPDHAANQQKAFLSELIYTIATAAVLTKGDLPVDVIAAA